MTATVECPYGWKGKTRNRMFLANKVTMYAPECEPDAYMLHGHIVIWLLLPTV